MTQDNKLSVILKTPVNKMTVQQAQNLMEIGKEIAKTVKDVKEHFLTELEKGKKIKGVVLTPSRNNRVWKNNFKRKIEIGNALAPTEIIDIVITDPKNFLKLLQKNGIDFKNYPDIMQFKLKSVAQAEQAIKSLEFKNNYMDGLKSFIELQPAGRSLKFVKEIK